MTFRRFCGLRIHVGVCFLLVFLSLPGQSQNPAPPPPPDTRPVITLKEVDRRNQVRPVDKPSAAYPAVDINSTLVIELNKEAIQAQAAKLIGYRYPIPQEKITQLIQWLGKEKEIVGFLQYSQNETIAQRKEKLNQFSRGMGAFLDVLIATYPTNTQERNQLNDILKQGNLQSYQVIYSFVNDQIRDIDQSLQKALDSNKVYFRLGGWLRNKYGENPVHIPDFDTYQEGQFYEVPNFITAIPPQELARFEQLQALAKDLQTTNANILTGLRKQLKLNVDSYINFFDLQVLAKLKTTREAIPAEKMTAVLSTSFENLTTSVQDLQSALARLQQAASDSTTFTFVAKLNTALQEVSQQLPVATKAVRSQGTIIVTALRANSVDAGDLPAKLQEAEGKLAQLINELQPLVTSLNNLPNPAAQKPQVNSLIFGEEVLKLSLDNLPDSTYLDLRTSGFRENDDELYLKASLGKQPAATASAIERTVYFKKISLFQVLMHSTAAAVMIFTDNLDASFANGKQFQLNPSFSVLFKWGTRSNLFYNRYVSAGLGLNVSTLDFDSDGTPEIGLGLTGSIFKDYVQAGLGRNFASGHNYWFFGVRIPLLGISFSGAPPSNVQVAEN